MLKWQEAGTMPQSSSACCGHGVNPCSKQITITLTIRITIIVIVIVIIDNMVKSAGPLAGPPG